MIALLLALLATAPEVPCGDWYVNTIVEHADGRFEAWLEDAHHPRSLWAQRYFRVDLRARPPPPPGEPVAALYTWTPPNRPPEIGTVIRVCEVPLMAAAAESPRTLGRRPSRRRQDIRTRYTLSWRSENQTRPLLERELADHRWLVGWNCGAKI